MQHQIITRKLLILAVLGSAALSSIVTVGLLFGLIYFTDSSVNRSENRVPAVGDPRSQVLSCRLLDQVRVTFVEPIIPESRGEPFQRRVVFTGADLKNVQIFEAPFLSGGRYYYAPRLTIHLAEGARRRFESIREPDSGLQTYDYELEVAGRQVKGARAALSAFGRGRVLSVNFELRDISTFENLQSWTSKSLECSPG